MAHKAGRHSQTWCKTRFTHGLCSGYRSDSSTTLALIGISFPANQGQIEILCSCSCHSQNLLRAEDERRYELAKDWTEQLFNTSQVSTQETITKQNDKIQEGYFALFSEGLSYIKLGEYKMAVTYFTTAISAFPDSDLAYYSRGFSYRNLGNLEEAIKDYTEAIRLDPSPASYFGRGLSYDDLGLFEEAIKDYTEAIRLDPDDAITYYNRGLAYSDLDQNEKALKDLDEAIRLGPDDEMIETRKLLLAEIKGLAYKQKDEEAADTPYDKALAEWKKRYKEKLADQEAARKKDSLG